MEAVWRGTEAIDAQLATRLSPEQIDTMRSGLMALADIKAETTAAGAGRPRPGRRFRQFSPIFPVRDMARRAGPLRVARVQDVRLRGQARTTASPTATGSASTSPTGLDPAHGAGSTYLYVRDADALFEEWSRPGVGGVTHPVGPTPYGLREGSHVDPDGNLIRFGSPRGTSEEETD